MKIQIAKDIAGHTSIKVDGMELNNYVSELCLTQNAMSRPELLLKIVVSPLDELEVDLPDGVVIIDNTRDQD